SGAAIHLAGLSRDLHAGDDVALTRPGEAPALRTVTAIQDAIWYANHAGADPTQAPSGAAIPIPVVHSQATLDADAPAWPTNVTAIRFSWRGLSGLVDQPVAAFQGETGTLLADAPAVFPPGARAVVIADAAGRGMTGYGASAEGGAA